MSDSWRFRSPAPPHAPPHTERTAGLPQEYEGRSGGGPLLGGDTLYHGPISPEGAAFGTMVAAVIVTTIFSPIIFSTLYPLAAGTSIASFFATSALVARSHPGIEREDLLMYAVPAGIVVFWIMCRIDHRLAAYIAPYRWARHVVRLLLIGSFIATDAMDGRWIPGSVGQLRAMYFDPTHWLVIGVCALLVHWVITRRGLRDKWHAGLEFFRLRPHGLH